MANALKSCDQSGGVGDGVLDIGEVLGARHGLDGDLLVGVAVVAVAAEEAALAELRIDDGLPLGDGDLLV